MRADPSLSCDSSLCVCVGVGGEESCPVATPTQILCNNISITPASIYRGFFIALITLLARPPLLLPN